MTEETPALPQAADAYDPTAAAEGQDVIAGEYDGEPDPEEMPEEGPEADLSGEPVPHFEDEDEADEGIDADPAQYVRIIQLLDQPHEGLDGIRERVGATNLSSTAATTILRRLGWRVRTSGEFRQALKNFQRGWALGPALAMDGALGPKTSAALRASEAARRAGRGTASAHFSFREFACKCGGRYTGCPRIWVHRATVMSLESMRRLYYPRGLVVVSACRCSSHNRATPGAARNSQHLYGGAVDIAPAVRANTLAARRLWSGIGRSASTTLVRHVDRRDAAGRNTTGGTPTRPTVWNYAR